MFALEAIVADFPIFKGQPPRTTSSATSRAERAGGEATGRSPANNADSDISPDDSPLSKRLMVRIVSLAIRPAPECRRTSSSGTDDPVSMNWPGVWRRFTSERTKFHTLVPSSCHSSMSCGGAPFSTSEGSTCSARRAASSVSRYTKLLACCSAVNVLPDAFGPSRRTAPVAASRDATSASTTLGRYSMDPPYATIAPNRFIRTVP